MTCQCDQVKTDSFFFRILLLRALHGLPPGQRELPLLLPVLLARRPSKVDEWEGLLPGSRDSGQECSLPARDAAGEGARQAWDQIQAAGEGSQISFSSLIFFSPNTNLIVRHKFFND